MTLRLFLPLLYALVLTNALVRAQDSTPAKPAAPKPPSVFLWPMLHEMCQRIMEEGAALVKRGELERAEELMRLAVQRGGFNPLTHYNLGCVLALRGKPDDAFAALTTAVEVGYRDADYFAKDEDLTKLRPDPRFATLLDKVKERAKLPLNQHAELGAIEDGVAWVSNKNVVWDPRLNVLRTLFKPVEWPTPPDVVKGHGAVGEKLKKWFAEGTAAGHRGDLYDNCDRDHSNMSYGDFPQLTRIEYAKEDGVVSPHGLQLEMFHGMFNGGGVLGNPVVLGNSSTANVGSPFWRSHPRQAYVLPRGCPLLYMQYVSNHLYFYPEHRDHDLGLNGQNDGHGDVYPANTPYLITSKGSSGSDVAFMNAVACTLAAFRPDVKRTLIESGLLMPTVQMIFRASNKPIAKPDDYLTGAAHPSAFESANLNVERMVDMAHELTRETLPAMVQLRVVEEDQPVVGRDYFDVGERERLFDTPCAIARIHRSTQYRRKIVVSAEASRDLNNRPLKFHWVVLRGDAEKITIKPRNDNQSVVELSIPYHGRRPIGPESKLESNRVDIGVFVHNGANYSAPGFVCVYTLDNEQREYDGERIKSVTYTGATDKGNYVDPVLDLPKSWRDEYRYDDQQRLLGWTRIRGESKEEFTPEGDLIVTRDSAGRPEKVRKVRYVPKPRDKQPPVLEQELGEERKL